MPRFKDHDINLPLGQKNAAGSIVRDWESIKVGILMDIRDELKEMNCSLHALRDTANRTDRRLAKHLPLKKVP